MGEARKKDSDVIADQQEIIRGKNKELVELRRIINKHADNRLTVEKVRKEIFNLAEYSPEPPKWLNVTPGKSSTGIPLIPLGDWHWGEYVDRDQVGGANEFNRAIGRQRVRQLNEAVIDLCFHHMTNPSYPGAVIPLIGDLITGNIHEDLALTNDGPVMWSVNEVENQILGLILSWKKKFKKIAVVCVPGNHGRNTPKPRINNKIYESYEWLIYCHIEQYFRDDPDVAVYVPNEVDAFFSIFGHKFMLTHGDMLGVKGGDGLIGALGPIARGTMKIGAQQRQIGRDFDTLLIGHYHFHLPRGDATPVLVNPALIGHNTYAHLQLRVRANDPAQALTFIHPKWGFTAQWKMILDGRRKVKSNDPWFVWGGARTNRDLDLG
jgi:predicted phosphodiesterase